METLRERKKQRTRDALLRAAVELFTTRGYERTTVDDIAEAVDVSQRTFFRYFAGKEEAALALQELVVTRFVEAVRERPAREAPMEALKQAVLEGWQTLNEVIEAVGWVAEWVLDPDGHDTLCAGTDRHGRARAWLAAVPVTELLVRTWCLADRLGVRDTLRDLIRQDLAN